MADIAAVGPHALAFAAVAVAPAARPDGLAGGGHAAVDPAAPLATARAARAVLGTQLTQLPAALLRAAAVQAVVLLTVLRAAVGVLGAGLLVDEAAGDAAAEQGPVAAPGAAPRAAVGGPRADLACRAAARCALTAHAGAVEDAASGAAAVVALAGLARRRTVASGRLAASHPVAADEAAI